MSRMLGAAHQWRWWMTQDEPPGRGAVAATKHSQREVETREWTKEAEAEVQDEPSHDEMMRIADAQIERWDEAFGKLAEYDSHGHTTGLAPDDDSDTAC